MIKNSGGPFLCGAEPTLADCCLAPALERYTLGYIDHVPKEALDAYPAIKLYLQAFKALPQVLAYEQSKSQTLKGIRTFVLLKCVGPMSTSALTFGIFGQAIKLDI
jgi:hypothetical protein